MAVHEPFGEIYIPSMCSTKLFENHNFQDTPTDTRDRGEVAEDTIHYFLKCNLYTEYRELILEYVLCQNNIPTLNQKDIVKVLLYGHSILDDPSNSQILRPTIKFLFNKTF